MFAVSIISIAQYENQLEALRHALTLQQRQDFEFIGEVGDSQPASWKRAIRRASGEILVFLEAGAKPVNERWLEELVAEVKDANTIVKGLEITSSPLDPSSLAGYREAFVDNPFDESYPWAEDTELFCRLQAAGYHFSQLGCAPVIHPSKPGSKTVLRRAFHYGLYYQRLRYRYANPVELNSIPSTIKLMVASLLNLLGVFVGSILYWNEK